MKKNIHLLFAVMSLCFLFFSCGDKTELKIYSILPEEETRALTELFTQKTGIPVTYLRATTGELVNRVIAEKDNPQTDILLGGATNYHILADEAGALETYNSPAADSIPEYARSENGTWTGFCVLTLGIGINRKRFSQKFPDMEYPKTWDDLLNPAFNGELVLTNPVASSTAYLFVQNQLQRLGWEDGWNYLLQLAPLVGQFPDSGNAPPRLIGTGEYALGVSFIHSLAKYASEGFDIQFVSPPETIGDVDCVSIMKHSKNLDAAKQFVDFMLSAEAQELMSSIDFTIPVNPNAKAAEGSILLSEIDLIDYDVKTAVLQKNDVLKKWSENVK